LKTDFLVVGAGFAGAVSAERLASAGYSILVIDSREHIGGNAYDCQDAAGIQIHPYGPHIFHTNSERIARYLSRFTDWRPYEHRVLAEVNGKFLPIPINRTTINQLYGLNLDEAGAERYLESVREERATLSTSEDVVIARVGRDLCDKFFRGYTRKQWNRDLSELDASVAARIPVRSNDDDRYFTDSFQKMPREGFAAMFRNILDHPNIRVELATSFEQARKRVHYERLVYTGRIDGYFDCPFGELPYRSLQFEHEHFAGMKQFQPVGTVNYPNRFAYTRITEFKHLTGQQHSGTSIVREYPCDEGDPYYPVPNAQNAELYRRYSELAEAERNTIFVGRLAQYRYLNMDQVVGSALKAVEVFTEPSKPTVFSQPQGQLDDEASVSGTNLRPPVSSE
jgi:UDP-galactopyranose mutase